METSNSKPDNQFSRPGIYDRIQKKALGKLGTLYNLPAQTRVITKKHVGSLEKGVPQVKKLATFTQEHQGGKNLHLEGICFWAFR